MILYSFNTGDLHIEYLKIEGENAIVNVSLDCFPKIKERLDITKKVVCNYDYLSEVHSLIEDYEAHIYQEYISEYHNEQNENDYANN